MAVFSYLARDREGKKIAGTEEAASQEDVINRLQSRDLIVIQVDTQTHAEAAAMKQAGPSTGVRSKPKHYGVTADDLVLFCRQLATLLGAGITILKSLEVISLQVSSRKLYNVLKTLKKNMEAGLSFHEAMSKHPDVFSDLWINLVESGEASGNLAAILNRLATYLEKNAAFKRKIISALVYPIILMLASTGALLFLTIKIIPTFAQLFAGFNITLPPLTIALISVSDFIRKFMVLIVVAIVVGIYVLKNYLKTREGRRSFEEFIFKLPLAGEFFRAIVIERFSSEMSTLIESGVPILYALEIAEHSVGNIVMGGIIRNIKEDVRVGKNLHTPLENSGFFEPMVVQMVTIGEEIGELSQMFKKINIFYQDYVDTFLTRFTAMFEPIILIFMGVVIGIMVIGMFLPIFQISKISG